MQFHETFGDFVLFLSIHLAFADGHLHPDEELVIIDKITKLFPYEGNPKKKFDLAVESYHKADKEFFDDFVSKSFKHFPDIKSAQRYKVYLDLYEIINADGKVDEAEARAMETLKSIIDLSAND
jgi:uncharacterized tellurite resistance protein B-like protein